MPHKDYQKHLEYQRPYQREWMVRKIKERNAQGICRVSGCGEKLSEHSKQYCEKHRLMKVKNDADYRKRKKEAKLAAN